MSLLPQDFFSSRQDLEYAPAIAVGVSGGPDSMALCWMLAHSLRGRGVAIHAITVDHALRPESADEADHVGTIVQNWQNVCPVVLRWEGDKPNTRILEEARAARYALMRDYMQSHGIKHLFIAHHQDDQAETFLIRLSKGSGLDGLSGMAAFQEKDGIILCRPLLGVSKDDLVALCRAQNIPFVEDPTNGNEKYLRPRLRAARDILAEEGLSAKRLSVTAMRLGRARRALEQLSTGLFDSALRETDTKGFLFNWAILKAAPEELVLRVLLDAVDRLHPAEDYGPRMEKMENLLHRLFHEDGFKSATLGGCLFAIHGKDGTLRIERE